MIEVHLVLDPQLCICRLRVDGHSMRPVGGTSAACAAVSALVRTAARLVEADPLIRSEGSADREGALELWIGGYDASRGEWLRGVSDSLVLGLRDVEREYPEECRLDLNTQEECRNGT